jgi:hypothetical protein
MTQKRFTRCWVPRFSGDGREFTFAGTPSAICDSLIQRLDRLRPRSRGDVICRDGLQNQTQQAVLA